MLALLAAAARHDRLDADGSRALLKAMRIVETRWQEPDAGIWELENEWWTHSRLSCVAGLRATSVVLPGAEGSRAASLADAVLAETDRRCLGPDGRWRRSPQHEGVDASLLLPPVRGALPAADPRTRATLEAVERDLVRDGFVYRFRPDARPLGQAEGAFLLCGFTMALAQWHQHREAEALRWFERTAATAGTSGLLSEEYDVDERQLRGNVPQAFVHAMLLETAQCLQGDAT
ncbi:hypothetical protein GCM10025868_29340 [Angustibacter aerolatus]|uniref:GH15-like domain-containing protein n=1 Tax=Angustibacter aerolatus TaxID=1162965 RepID=A0ABQ6JJX0_9ACTN|nr:glycoside hydrolase family 15 protein [Angustibacter aerolatus]GMA87684.1 hypothetical protein GCM10025868_29340 [Angustibacter aerolatus]